MNTRTDIMRPMVPVIARWCLPKVGSTEAIQGIATQLNIRALTLDCFVPRNDELRSLLLTFELKF